MLITDTIKDRLSYFVGRIRSGMKLFLNDKPVKVIQYIPNIPLYSYNEVIRGSEEILSSRLKGNVYIENVTPRQIERLIALLEIKKLKELNSITFAAEDYNFITTFIKDQFKIIKAAGGVVRKNDKILMILRLGKWDIPKGKLKKKEDSLRGAKREVEEECSIRVEVKEKLCSTWHSYIRKGKRLLKKTEWYIMYCTDDSNMQPQIEEFIDEVKWMSYKDVQKVVKDSYASIREVTEEYYRLHSDLVR